MRLINYCLWFEGFLISISIVLCRDGRFYVGDEIINVGGQRLRGVTLEEARNILKDTGSQVDIVIARDIDNPLHTMPYENESLVDDDLPSKLL